MRKNTLFRSFPSLGLAVLLLAMAVTAYAQSPSLTGREIIQKNRDSNKGYHDEISVGKMVLFESGGKIAAEREFEFRQLEGSGPQGDKSMIKILKPADLKGTGLLSFENKTGPDDQWLFLPAAKKTRRIAGLGKGGKFIGSEFAYEDLLPLDIDKYQYTAGPDESCSGGICYVVEATPRSSDSAYSKTVSWIRHDNNQIIKTRFFDKKGRLLKEADFTNFQLLGGKFYRPYRLTMTNAQTGKKTELVISSLKLSNGLSPADFTRATLER